MAYEHKLNTGTAFHNANKKSEKAPDWRMELNIEGKLYKFAGWEKQTKTGSTMVDWKLDTYEKTAAPVQAQPASGAFDNGADDLPF